MKISIITSCYNRENTIYDCINSIIKQDYPNIEYIIIDGKSQDHTMQIVSSFEAEITKESFQKHHPQFSIKIISEPDHGMYEAINKGIKMATGDYIGLVHSDDFLYTSHTISHIVEMIKKTSADFLYGDGLFVDSHNTNKIIRKWIGGKYRLWKVRHGWLPLHPTCYIRREVMLRNGLYNETYKIAADSDLLFRYLISGQLTVVYLNEYIIKMRMGGLSTDSKRRKEMWMEDLRMYNSHGINPHFTKIEKIMWKIPQFIKAKFKK